MSITDDLPLFPLHAVLFPQGRLSLKLFEARYLDMAARCMRHDTGFGVCLIAQGSEVGAAAVPHTLGVEARIVDWDMTQPGLLHLTVRGERRFRLLEHSATPQGLVLGRVAWFDEPPGDAPIPAAHRVLLPLLQAILTDAGKVLILPPHRLSDANWVGYRYAEILPISNQARQRLLELEDANLRLSIIQTYLEEHGLLGKRE